jgi:hypothetical protein
VYKIGALIAFLSMHPKHSDAPSPFFNAKENDFDAIDPWENKVSTMLGAFSCDKARKANPHIPASGLPDIPLVEVTGENATQRSDRQHNLPHQGRREKRTNFEKVR